MTDYRDATARQRKVADELAAMASDDYLRYDPVYEVTDGPVGAIWHLMLAVRLGKDLAAGEAEGDRWPYLLRREYGSYAGTFPPGYIENRIAE